MIETAAYRYLRFEREGAIALITLNRPEKRNALSLELMRELISALENVASDRAVRAAILRAEGEVFSAGHDLRELSCSNAEAHREIFDVCVALMQKIQAIPQPVIAEVAGIATAAGCQLVATCDLAIASSEATFATPGVRIGLFCTTPMVALTRAIGRKAAMEMLLTGDPIDADKAAALGLVNHVVRPEDLGSRTRALAAKIAASSRQIVALGKAAFYRQADLPVDEAYAYAQKVMTKNASAPDAQEGMAAFLERREPRWTGDH